MKIVVAIKQVPDSAAKVAVEGGTIAWGDAPLVMNPWDEYAMEAALVQADETGGDVIAVSFGGESAKDALLTRAIASEETLVKEPAADLLAMEGVDEALAYTLASHGILTMDDLAEQSVDELVEAAGIGGERAAQLIMKAREPWFTEAASV